jgi:hypothetical protein
VEEPAEPAEACQIAGVQPVSWGSVVLCYRNLFLMRHPPCLRGDTRGRLGNPLAITLQLGRQPGIKECEIDVIWRKRHTLLVRGVGSLPGIRSALKKHRTESGAEMIVPSSWSALTAINWAEIFDSSVSNWKWSRDIVAEISSKYGTTTLIIRLSIPDATQIFHPVVARPNLRWPHCSRRTRYDDGIRLPVPNGVLTKYSSPHGIVQVH